MELYEEDMRRSQDAYEWEKRFPVCPECKQNVVAGEDKVTLSFKISKPLTFIKQTYHWECLEALREEMSEDEL